MNDAALTGLPEARSMIARKMIAVIKAPVSPQTVSAAHQARTSNANNVMEVQAHARTTTMRTVRRTAPVALNALTAGACL